MISGSLFKWFCHRLSILTLIIVIISAWWMSSVKYDKDLNVLKTLLLTKALQVNNGADPDSLLEVGLNYSLINSQGLVVSNQQFGTFSAIADSQTFRKALLGQSLLRVNAKDWSKEVEYWGRVSYKGAPHVLVLKQQLAYSPWLYFMAYMLVMALVGLVVIMLFALIITKPLKNALIYLTADIDSLRLEKFEKKQAVLDCTEFAVLCESFNKFSSYIQSELHSLRTEVSQWGVFFSTMPRGLIAIDRDRIIHNCNNNALKLLDVGGTRNQDVRDKSVMSVFRNADLNRITSDFFKSGQFLREYEFEMMINNLLESFKIVCVELEFPDTEDPKGAIVIIENISSLRHLENMRKDFVANVSHELKTPISIISGFIETLKECLDDPESSLKFLTIIQKNAARLTVIIDDLLNLSKLEQNEAVIRKDFENRPISESIHGALDVCSHEAESKNITINLKLEKSQDYGGDTLVANHRLLEQALRNLIENAIRYSPVGSEISILSRRVGETIEISVKDNGHGIAKEHQDKIFRRFYRVDKSRDRQTGGSGLGLAIVKHISRIHNGKVSLESEPGRGSTFTIALPDNAPAGRSLNSAAY